MHDLEKITVYRLKVPLAKPYRLSFGAVEHYDTIVVELVGRDGGAIEQYLVDSMVCGPRIMSRAGP